jgi:DNA gyrase/topoisomerase IV subunit A
MGKYHPHGDDSIQKAVNNLARLGILDGQGQFGCKAIKGADTEAAAGRYTECKLSKRYRDIIEPLLPYVPMIEGEIEGMKEPEYLPLPIPLAFIFGGIGLGVGCNARIPMFDTYSVIDALFNDTPEELKAPYGMKINHEKSELSQLWHTGVGSIQYEYNVTVENISGNELIVISADAAEVFKPNLALFDKYTKSGKMYTIDLTDATRVAVGIGRNPYVDKSNFDECLEIAKKVAVSSKTYRLTVADVDGTSYVIPLREWLRSCYLDYIELVKKMKEDKLNRANFNKEVYILLPAVGKAIINNPDITDKELLSSIKGLRESVLRTILTKSISQLRKGDTTKEVEKYQKEIEYWEALVPTEYTNEVLEALI